MKIDSFLQIQLGTVYRGLSPVSDEEVLRLYKNKIIPLAYVETHGKNAQVTFWKKNHTRAYRFFFVLYLCVFKYLDVSIQNKTLCST